MQFLRIFVGAVVVVFFSAGCGERSDISGVELYQTSLSGKVKRVKKHRFGREYWFEGDSLSYMMSFYPRGGIQLAEWLISRGDSVIKEADSDSVLVVHDTLRIKYRLMFAVNETEQQVEELKRQKGQVVD